MSVMTKNMVESSPPIDYIKAITQLIRSLPIEQVVQVYDYALQLQPQKTPQLASQASLIEDIDPDDDSWLFSSEEEMAEEDELWDTFLAQNQVYFNKLENAVDAEIMGDMTQPMFDESGELIAHEITHNP
ncbi:MAG: hypothetical protein AAF639_19735 [Chloroflexota bacterium]